MTESKPTWLTVKQEEAYRELEVLIPLAATTSKPRLHSDLTLRAMMALVDAPVAFPRVRDYALYPRQQKILDDLKAWAVDHMTLIGPASPYLRILREHTNIDDHFVYGLPLVVEPKLRADEFKIVQQKPRQSVGRYILNWPSLPGKNTLRSILKDWDPAPKLRPRAAAYIRERMIYQLQGWSSIVGTSSMMYENSFRLHAWEPYPVDLEPTPIPFPIHHFTRIIRAALGVKQ